MRTLFENTFFRSGSKQLVIAAWWLLTAFSVSFPLGTADAQQTAQLEGRWRGSLYGGRCGMNYFPSVSAVVSGQTIALEINHLDQIWRTTVDIQPDGTIDEAMRFALESSVVGEVAAVMFLSGKFSNGRFQDGEYAVAPDTGSWDCQGTFVLNPVDRPKTVIAESSDQGGTAQASTTASQPFGSGYSPARDLALWKSIKDSIEPEKFKTYIERFPAGKFTTLARIRLKSLERTAPRSSVPSAGQDNFGENPYPGIDFGRYVALVIGNNSYEFLPNLKTATTDARAIARLLRDEYGFKVDLMLNASRSDVIDALARYRATLRPQDNLLVYYAGHGILDEITDRGYWLPVDAKPNTPSNWIPTRDVTAALQAMRAKHVMVVADSCYSGKLVRSAPVTPPTARTSTFWMERMNSKRSRTALTSGGLEPVLDSGGGRHSVFARAFIAALEENQTVLEGIRLFDAIKRPVVVNSDQTPQYSKIPRAGHDGGDFIFLKRK